MAEETIGRATIQLGADGSKLGPEMAAAVAKAQGALERANKQMEKAQASTFKAIQGHIDKINATRPTNEMRMLEQAVLKLGGSSKLSGDQLKRVTLEVNQLAAAGAKIPASLSSLTGMGSKLGAAFSSLTTGGGVSGALAAIGPAGIAAAGALGAVTLAGTKAFGAISDLASQAEQWSNIAQSTGLGIETVQKLSAMLEDAGIPAEALKKGMKALSDEIAGGGKQLEQFGISVKGWDLMSQEERLRAFARVITDIEDPAVASAVAVAGLGKSGADLIPVMDDVASGAYEMYSALDPAQTAALQHANEVLDNFGRKWANTKKIVLSSLVQMVQGFKGFAGAIPIFIPDAGVAAASAPGAPKPTSNAEAERKKAAAAFAAKAANAKRERDGEAAAKKAADEMLAVRKKYNELQASIVKATNDEADTMRDLDEMSKSLLATQEKIARDSLNAQKETRLRGGDMLPSLSGSGLWTKHQDVLDQEMANAAEQTKKTTEATTDWTSSLADLAVTFQGFGGILGAVGAAVVSLAGSFSLLKKMGTGADGKFSLGNLGASMKTFEGKMAVGSAAAGALGSLGGALGGGNSVAGSALGGAAAGAQMGAIAGPWGMAAGALIGGAIGFFKGSKLKADAKEAGKILGKNVSVEQLKGLKEQAKAAGMEWKAFLKQQKKEEEKAAKIETRQKLEAGLGQAAQFAQQLQARIDAGGLSEKLKAAAETMIGKVRDALLKSGMGMQLDPALAKSEAFQGAQGAAGDIAGILSGMRGAGMVDAGLMGAAATSSQELFDQAVAAAAEAGKAPAEAQQAGFGAISQLLREQLNASIQSGNELDANTQKLLDEAKANGIEIMADPMIESLAVQQKQLAVLEAIDQKFAGGGLVKQIVRNSAKSDAEKDFGAASGFGPMITPNLGGGLGPRIQTHPGELAMVIPRSKMGPGGLLSAASGIYSRRGGGVSRGRAISTTSINLTIAENPFQSAEGAARLRSHTLKTVERETSKHLASLIASGRA